MKSYEKKSSFHINGHKKTINEKSKQQETQVAKSIGGRPVISSGSLWFSKGDSRSKEFLCECKITSKKSYSLTFDTWNKIRKEAIKDGIRTPIMNIQLEDGKYSYAVVPYSWCQDEIKCDIKINTWRKEGKSFSITPKYFLMRIIKMYGNMVFDLVVMKWDHFEDILDAREKTNE